MGVKGEKGEPAQIEDTNYQKGQKGEPGFDGRIGNTGLPGLNGERGPPGSNGYNGVDGARGDKGDLGEKGECLRWFYILLNCDLENIFNLFSYSGDRRVKKVIHRSNHGARLQKIQLKKGNVVNQDGLAIRVIEDLMGEMEAPERLVKNL